MQVNEVIACLIDRAGLGVNGMSRALGKSREWARKAARAKASKLDTVADVADVAGVDVVLIDRATGKRVGVVDPPRRAGED